MYRFRHIGFTRYKETIREIAATAGEDTIDVFGPRGDWPGGWDPDSVSHNDDSPGFNAREPWDGETLVVKGAVNTNALKRYTQRGPTEERACYLYL